MIIYMHGELLPLTFGPYVGDKKYKPAIFMMGDNFWTFPESIVLSFTMLWKYRE